MTVSHYIGKVPRRIWDGIPSKTVVQGTNNLLTSALQVFFTNLKLIIILTKHKKLNRDFGLAKNTVAAAFLKLIFPAVIAED